MTTSECGGFKLHECIPQDSSDERPHCGAVQILPPWLIRQSASTTFSALQNRLRQS